MVTFLYKNLHYAYFSALKCAMCCINIQNIRSGMQ